MSSNRLTIRRALLSVSDKQGIVDLGRALDEAGAELIATGKTAQVLKDAGLPVTPIEEITGNPEAFQGRMKTLSFQVCSGILYRRGDKMDEEDARQLGIQPIDCVVVNFYPFEAAAARPGITRQELVEEIDIGGPTLVRAAAKNSPQVLVVADPTQYPMVIADLQESGTVSLSTLEVCARRAWRKVMRYDSAIVREFGGKRVLRYGENPHQAGILEFDADGPIAWDGNLTSAELSYNNILDLTSAYAVLGDLRAMNAETTGVVIVKHNNPCGVAAVPKSVAGAQKLALLKAWEGDPVSAFGGVVGFTDPIEEEVAAWLSERFVELVSAPGLEAGSSPLERLLMKRKNLKAVAVRRFGELPNQMVVSVPGGKLFQTPDTTLENRFQTVTARAWPEGKDELVRFGIVIARALKSNALALVREIPGRVGGYQLVGAGQGQPNRIDALAKLAIPRAQAVLRETGGVLSDCVLVSDAFFPFRDTVDIAYSAGIRFIVQPGGSLKDAESIKACDEHGMAMVFTGVRHFKH